MTFLAVFALIHEASCDLDAAPEVVAQDPHVMDLC